jgi:hypothetical protein
MSYIEIDRKALMAARTAYYLGEIANANAIADAFERAEAAFKVWEQAQTAKVGAEILALVDQCYADALAAAWASEDCNA